MEGDPTVQVMTVLKLFELGKLSSGLAARLAGISRVEFLELCARYKIPVADQDEAELREDLTRLSAWQK